jgi:hypothetical protein
MIEFLKHSLGLCGDGHPNLLYGLATIPFFVFLQGIKLKITLSLKNFLKQFYSYFYQN